MVPVKENLVESRIGEHVLNAVDAHLHGYHASARGRDGDVVHYLARRDEHLGPVIFSRHDVRNADALALTPCGHRHSIAFAMVIGEFERLGWLVESVQTRGAGAMGADERLVAGIRDGVLLETGFLEKILDQRVGQAGAHVRLASRWNPLVKHPRPGDAREADRGLAQCSEAIHGNTVPALALKDAAGDHVRFHAIDYILAARAGHTLGAAGGLESAVCVMALKNGIVPPTTNYHTPDPDCDLDYVPNQAREIQLQTAMNVNLGFGGHNAALVFRKV